MQLNSTNEGRHGFVYHYGIPRRNFTTRRCAPDRGHGSGGLRPAQEKQVIGFSKTLILVGLFLLLILGSIPCEAQSAGGIRSLRALAAERAVIRERVSHSAAAKEAQTIRYSGSAQASNMILPAILLGLPSIVILALIIRAMKGD